MHEGAVIGADCTLRQATTIGSKTLPDGTVSAYPVLGDGVDVGANAVILGAITRVDMRVHESQQLRLQLLDARGRFKAHHGLC